MRKLLISILVVGLVLGMSFGVMADNFADIDQSGGGFSEAYIEQIGNENDVFLEQYADDGNTSPWNPKTEINQDGENNLADIFQKTTQGSTLARLNLSQTGIDNEVYITQDANHRVYSDINQTGDRNLIKFEQPGNYGTEANFIMTQYGDDNMVVGVGKNQSAMWLKEWDNAYQDNSDFVGYQEGDNNTIGLYQGEKNRAVVDQVGNNNTALLWQGDSGSHSVNINQNGDNNVSEVIQTSN